MSVRRRVFPESFKREGVDRVANSGLTPGAVARELGLCRWMTQFGIQATGTSRRSTTQASSPSPSDLAAEVARLRRENGQLRMEREPTSREPTRPDDAHQQTRTSSGGRSEDERGFF